MMRRPLTFMIVSAMAVWTVAAGAIDLSAISNKDATTALRTALTQGASSAVLKLGRQDGFLGNPAVKIPLPPSLRKAEKTLRRLGMNRQADELIMTMNRAAEAAVPEAKTLLVDAVKAMTVTDAKSILTGGDDAATQYFRSKTSAQLAQRFRPIIAQATAKAGVAKSYNSVAGKAAQFGLVSAQEADLDSYITDQALDGLYEMIAVEEQAIRKDPLGQASSILQRVFGAVAAK